MKTERAIELLNRISDSQFDGSHGDERREALEMAVRALEQNLVQGSDGLVNDLVKDCISRQQAIDALDKHIDTFDAIDTNYLCGLRTAMSILKEMPSAQPETHDKRTETHACDLIGRQEAIDQLHQSYNLLDAEQRLEDLPSAQQQRILYANMSDAEFEKWLYEHGICNPNIHESIPCDVVPLLIDYAISELPSAQPERKNGKWITVEGRLGNEVECDKCHSVFWYWMGNYRFCPSCGADMRGEIDE